MNGLNFLGDSVLDMIVVDMLYRKFPMGDEGDMTRMKARLVSREALNFLGEEIGVEHLLDAQTGKGAVHASLRGNAMEALVGAVYLDRGFRRAQRGGAQIASAIRPPTTRIQATVDFKSKLHEWGQKRKRKVQFKVVREFKREGQQLYQMQVLVGGKVMGTSDGPSKKVRRAGCGSRGPVVISSATIRAPARTGPPPMRTVQLDIGDETIPYAFLGVSCTDAGHKFCWNLNRTLGTTPRLSR